MEIPPVPTFLGRRLGRLSLLVLAVLITSACNARIVPKAVVGLGPIECSVTVDLKLSCSVGREWMAALGPVKVGLGFDAFPDSNGALILTIKQLDGTSQAWQVGEDARPLCLEQSGDFTTRIGRNIVEVSPHPGARIRITDPEQTGHACVPAGPDATPSVSASQSGDGITIVMVPNQGGTDGGGITPGGGPTEERITPPNEPSNVAATAIAPDTVRVSWTDDSLNEDNFAIVSGPTTRLVSANVTSYDWVGLAQGSELCIQVRSINSGGASALVPASARCATTPTVAMTPPSFVYPVDGQTLGIDGSYLFKVTSVPNASGYVWGFFQDGQPVWENYHDEGALSGTEYGIAPGTTAHDRFHRGPVEVWVRAYVYSKWTDATIITINLA